MNQQSIDNRPVVTTVDELKHYIGQEISVSAWQEVSQERVNQFADATAFSIRTGTSKYWTVGSTP